LDADRARASAPGTRRRNRTIINYAELRNCEYNSRREGSDDCVETPRRLAAPSSAQPNSNKRVESGWRATPKCYTSPVRAHRMSARRFNINKAIPQRFGSRELPTPCRHVHPHTTHIQQCVHTTLFVIITLNTANYPLMPSNYRELSDAMSISYIFGPSLLREAALCWLMEADPTRGGYSCLT
ncbi:hypothetical protein JYU34_002068, partial [Plutella xylostella]